MKKSSRVYRVSSFLKETGLTTKEVSYITGFSERSLYYWMKKGAPFKSYVRFVEIYLVHASNFLKLLSTHKKIFILGSYIEEGSSKHKNLQNSLIKAEKELKNLLSREV